jgi:ribosomal protein L15E
LVGAVADPPTATEGVVERGKVLGYFDEHWKVEQGTILFRKMVRRFGKWKQSHRHGRCSAATDIGQFGRVILHGERE